MQNNWFVLLPAIIMLSLAFSTHRIIVSLACGIISAALILNNFAIWPTIQTIADRIWKASEIGSLASFEAFKNNWAIFMLSFLVILGIIIVLINHSGGAWAYGNFIKKKLKNKTSAQTASLSLSLLFFIDDYLSCLTVGSVMRPLTDKFKIARAKLAFLVDSMAAPLCILTPISSWVAYIIMQFKKAGISDTTKEGTSIFADPFVTYLKTIPFVFYSIIIIISSWFIVRRNISIGLMKKHEDIADNTGNLFGGKTETIRKMREIDESQKKSASMIDFLLPLAALIITIITGMLYTGNFYLLGGNKGFFEAFRSANTAASLCTGSLITLLTTLLLFFRKKKIKYTELGGIFADGFRLMGRCLVVLILAWTLSSLLRDDLGTGEYLANLLLGYVNIKLVPLLFFVICSITSISMGSAWGCMAIMIPIAVPMTLSLLQLSTPASLEQASIILPTLGAILSGAVTGNHISPLADTTIVSAASTGAYHIDHVRTQQSYAIPALFCSGIAFLVSGLLISYPFVLNVIVSVGIGLLCNFAYLQIRYSFAR